MLGSKLPELDIVRAKRSARMPTVVSPGQVQALLSKMAGTPRLMASLLYGSGLRLQECVTLRVKDVDFAARQLFIRRGKGRKDRAASLVEPLSAHLAEVKQLTNSYGLNRGPFGVKSPLDDLSQ